MMKTRILSLILLGSFSLSLFAKEFKFNNKNLNAIAALICESQSSITSLDIINSHKISISKTKLGEKLNDYIFEVSGTCNIQFSKNKKKVTDFGEEFTIDFDLKNLSSSHGKLGIKDIKFKFINNNLQAFSIVDPLLLTQNQFLIGLSHWAKNDSIFSFSKKPMNIKIGRKTAAVEKNNILELKNKDISYFFKTWSFESFGCTHSKDSISETQCEQISKLLN